MEQILFSLIIGALGGAFWLGIALIGRVAANDFPPGWLKKFLRNFGD